MGVMDNDRSCSRITYVCKRRDQGGNNLRWQFVYAASVKLKEPFLNLLLTNVGKCKAELEDNIDGSKSIKNSSSNKVAKHLRDRRYRQIVIKNKKAYNRKKYEDYSRDS